MGPTASDVIALAQNTKALTKEQLAKILKLAPTMTSADLENLKKMILGVQEAEMKEMKRQLEVYKKAASAHEEWKADTSRNALKTQEGAVAQEDQAQAEALIQNL